MVIAVQIAMKILMNVLPFLAKIAVSAPKALLVNIIAPVLLVSKEIIVKLTSMNVSWIPVFSTPSVRIPVQMYRCHLAIFPAIASNLSAILDRFVTNVQMAKVETPTGNARNVNSLKSITSQVIQHLVLIRNAQTGLE